MKKVKFRVIYCSKFASFMCNFSVIVGWDDNIV